MGCALYICQVVSGLPKDVESGFEVEGPCKVGFTSLYDALGLRL